METGGSDGEADAVTLKQRHKYFYPNVDGKEKPLDSPAMDIGTKCEKTDS